MRRNVVLLYSNTENDVATYLILTTHMSAAGMHRGLQPWPDQTFHYSKAFKSDQLRILWRSETSMDKFWGREIVNCSVGNVDTATLVCNSGVSVTWPLEGFNCDIFFCKLSRILMGSNEPSYLDINWMWSWHTRLDFWTTCASYKRASKED